MMYRILIITSFFLIAGCKSKNAVPSDVLSQKEMQTVLFDMMRADRFLSDYVFIKDSTLKKTEESIKLYQQVLAINKITKEKFERSFDFYKEHPAFLKVIMDSIASTQETVIATPPPKVPNKDTLKIIGDSLTNMDTTSRLKKLRKFNKPIPAKL